MLPRLNVLAGFPIDGRHASLVVTYGFSVGFNH
jgi:hypothetical protein